MEADRPFDNYELHILPRAERVATWIREHITLLPPETDLKTSTHLRDKE